MKNSVLIFLFFILKISLAANPTSYSISSKLDAVESIYTQPLVKLIQAWPPVGLNQLEKENDPVKIICFGTPQNDLYIGAEQLMIIDADMSEVEKILDDFSHYKDLFDGLINVEVKNPDKNRFNVILEQEVPIPFVSNEKNEMVYLVDKSQSNRKIYRYQLKSSNHLKYNDGAIVIESLSKGKTLYVEFDFWDAEWGIAKSFAPERIWKDSLEGLYQSDMAVKLRAENKGWDYKRIKEMSKDLAKSPDLLPKIKNKKEFYFLKSK